MRIDDFRAVSEAQDLAALQGALVRFSHKMDFGTVSTLFFEGDLEDESFSGWGFGNVPPGYQQHHSSMTEALQDPVITQLRTSNLPLTYDQDFYVGARAGHLWEVQAAYGLKTGVAVALHLPRDRHVFLGVDRDSSLPSSTDQLTRVMADVHLMAVHVQEAANRLFFATQAAGSSVKLTAKELEVMKWSRDGKSAWVVGQIMSCSENTVKFHRKNVMRKLGVHSKQEAVLRCISFGLI